MKRSLVLAVIIGFVAAAIFAVLHATRLIAPIENNVLALFSHHRVGSKSLGAGLEYGVLAAAGLLVAFLTMTTARRGRLALIIVALILELVVACWIFSLYRVAFQPLPAIGAAMLAFAMAFGFVFFTTRSRANMARTFFEGRLSRNQISRVIEGDIPLETT